MTPITVEEAQQILVQPVDENNVHIVVQEQTTSAIEVTGEGPQGPPGPAGGEGPPGPRGETGEGDKNFEFKMESVESVWQIQHNLGKFPSVVVIDSGGTDVEGEIQFEGPDRLTLIFSAPFSGTAYLN